LTLIIYTDNIGYNIKNDDGEHKNKLFKRVDGWCESIEFQLFLAPEWNV